MNLKFYQQKGFTATLCAAIILIAIPIVTDVYKESFVSETGHFKIMGGLSIILACLLNGNFSILSQEF
ncbi:hypothetical protein QUH73_00810 [Labilibaculum sp. K2S]|uniref:hypothetical protein n=1 Tax=Labilibaculum sp. K2S TaxID=3056386 RepID=UPI0025A407F5|nr:hypothetical protein [Labilibaculum sp. K2S]MDM8158343.1 hypothetical protein [Labilibaculum sp. K2S]